MGNFRRVVIAAGWSVVFAGCGGGGGAVPAAAPVAAPTAPAPAPPPSVPSLQPFADPTGTAATYTAAGSILTDGVFFAKLGTNQRTCATCHRLDQGMTITAAGAQALYAANPSDALFDPRDGANCPSVGADDEAGHSLVLNYGLIRVARELPASAEFHIVAASDPYGCAQQPDAATGLPIISVYRRPLPATNLNFLANVMWDARETLAPLGDPATHSANLDTDLAAQAADAVATHAAGTVALSAAQLAQIVAFERGLFTAQTSDTAAGSLSAGGALGGPVNLAQQAPPSGPPAPGPVFTLFQAWLNSSNPQQASIARGEDIFNRAPMNLGGLAGVNLPPGAPAHCATCHSTPNVGGGQLLVDTGTSHDPATEADPAVRAALAQLSRPALPVYTITGCPANNGAPVATSDPGVALTTGLCADVNRLKVPGLRGLAARAPYFHNGSAATLAEVVDFYNVRFHMQLSPQQRQDLANFLSAL